MRKRNHYALASNMEDMNISVHHQRGAVLVPEKVFADDVANGRHPWAVCGILR